jgi:thioredoxin reductase/pSer/pThr/pTyr-binding forkhead associated (FHA) protein/ferredoxin
MTDDSTFDRLFNVDGAAAPTDVLDVLIVGAGPAGTAAAFRARELGLRALVIDFDDIMKRIRDYPKDKLILPDFGGGDRMRFPLAGQCVSLLQFGPIDKDDICLTWKAHYATLDVPVAIGVELTGLQRGSGVWRADAWNHRTREPTCIVARHVVLAIGRGVPRRFDIPGNTDGITYRLDDADAYVDGPVCVIGGGTSAAEAVIAISKAKVAEGDASQVFWSYRGTKMPRVSKALADEFFEAYVGNGNIRYQPNSEPVAIVTGPDRLDYLSVRVDRIAPADRPPETVHLEFPKTRCIACIGEDVPEAFLRGLGIHMLAAGPQGKKMFVVTPLLETCLPNVYLIGDLLSQAYLEADDFDAPTESARQVKHRGNIKAALRDGVFVAEVIRQRLEGRAQVSVVIQDAPASEESDDRALSAVAAPAAETTGAAVGDAPLEPTAVLVSVTPAGTDAENFQLRSEGATTIGRTACDIAFEHDTALSDSHASISHRDGNWYLRDDGSRSGTYLRLGPDAPMPVPVGGLLRAGRQILVVRGDQHGFYLDQYDVAGRPVQRHTIGARPTVFGRSGGRSQPDVLLDDGDMTLSRFHFSAVVHGDRVLVQDFGSRNGTYFKIDVEQRLAENDTFRVGGQLLRIRLAEDLPEKTGSSPIPASAPAAATPAPPAPVVRSTASGPHITFVDQAIAGAADAAETLLEWADARDVAIDNECWIGMCGCDAIRIVEGAEFLSAVTEKEIKTLTRKGLEPGPYRLACMARCSGPVVVEVAD